MISLNALMLAASLVAPMHAEDPPPAPRTELGQLRISISEMVAQEVKNGRNVSLRLGWDYLPESLALKQRLKTEFGIWAGSRSYQASELKFSNAQLKDEKAKEAWFRGLPEAQRNQLAAALTRGEITDARTTTLYQVLRSAATVWSEDIPTGLGYDEGNDSTRVRWHDYIAARREALAVRYLLSKECSGAAAEVEFDPAPRGMNPLPVMDGLQWRMRIFPLGPLSQPNPARPRRSEDRPIYRFAVHVETGTISRTFRPGGDDTTVDKAKLVTTVGLIRMVGGDPRMTPISIAMDDKKVITDKNPGADEVEAFDDKLSPSVGAVTFGALTNSTAGGLLAPLFENGSEASPFYGALIGNGMTSSVYGVNYILTDRTDGNFGFAYGIASKADNGLFLGPSYQFGPFTASVGGRIFNRQDNVTTGRLAGTLSLDLGRLFGKKTTPTPLSPKPVMVGSQVWQDVDAHYADSSALLYRVKIVGDAPRLGPMTMVHLTDGSSAALDKSVSYPVLYSKDSIKAMILPLGGYEVQGPADTLIASVDKRGYENGNYAETLFHARSTYLNRSFDRIQPQHYVVRYRGYKAKLTLVRESGPQPVRVVVTRLKNADGNDPSDAEKKTFPLIEGIPFDGFLPAGTYEVTAPENWVIKDKDGNYGASRTFTVREPMRDPRDGDIDATHTALDLSIKPKP